MKFLDKFLRRWRVEVALKEMPSKVGSVFDIGCDDGFLLRRIGAHVGSSSSGVLLDGCDPRLSVSPSLPDSLLLEGYFPAVMDGAAHRGPYDAIFSLAVFEHFSDVDLQNSASWIQSMLSDRGRLIVTVPHPFVDKILDLLIFLRLIEGQAVHEHHGFDPNQLADAFSGHLNLVSKKTFQLGLNNLYIFEKK